MSTSRHSVEALQEMLGPLLRARPMMGEYLLYWRDTLIGGIYDEKLLLKDLPPFSTAVEGTRICPYPGAKAMIAVPIPASSEQVDQLVALLENAWPQLPAPKKR